MASELTFKPMGSSVVTRKGLERLADIDPRLTRSFYFDSRLLTAEDLTRDQLYVDGRLREIGQTLGYGILRGLQLTYDNLNGLISVAPGLAVTAAGRVLELEKTLTIDLGERADIVELNDGNNRRFDRGLYAIIIKYSEVGTDIAEVFPTDLGDKRGFQYDVISEGVQLSLLRLTLPLPQVDPLQLRANLMHRLHGDNSVGGLIPEDSVALGVIAVSNDRPQWLDTELLRQPLRPSAAPGDLQADLHRRYQHLFNDIMANRLAGSLSGDFAATDYFRLLPPVGSLPKDSLDPVAGRQGFFPENFNVWIAPLRLADVELIRKESLLLPPIDLSLQEPMDIVVLTPLTNVDYGHYAQSLEQPLTNTSERPPALDLLRLRLYPKRPVHELDTDRDTWQAIWDTVAEQDLFFVRRPLRAAETRTSGIVLARGINLPDEPPPNPTPTPADNGLLADEDSIFINRINVTSLSNFRTGTTVATTDAIAAMQAEFGGDATALLQTLNIFLRVERHYDELVWPTVLSLARDEVLGDFLTQLIAGQQNDDPTGTVVANIGATFGLEPALITQWSNAVPQ